MTNLLQRAASFLGTKLKSSTVAGRTVTYHRGQLASDAIQGVCTQRQDEIEDEDGFVTSVTTFDWMFTATDVVIRGTQVEPRPADIISETLNGETVNYEVVAREGRPCFEWADSSGLLLVVHTNKVQ